LVDPIAITDEQPSPILDEGGKDGGGGRWKMDNVAGKKWSERKTVGHGFPLQLRRERAGHISARGKG
jgi:hypothetical protein